MAKLAAFQRDPEALSKGVWINPDPDFDIELRVKAKDALFADLVSIGYRKLIKNAKEDGRLKSDSRSPLNDLPPSAVANVENEIVLKYITDVRNLEDDAGAVNIEKFRKMAMTEEFRPLLDMALVAFNLATNRRASDQEEALGNSAPSRPTASRGAAPQP